MAAPVFRLGDRGPAVAEIKARLARLGLLPGSAHVRQSDPLDGLLNPPTPGGTVQAPPSEWETTALISAEFDADVEAAVRAFQAERGITVDGLVGSETFRRLEEARWRLGDRVLSYSPGHLFVGDDVLDLQRRLNQMGFNCGREDSHFGWETDRAVREFQRNVGLDTDGVCGPTTLRSLGQLHRTVGTSSAHVARERYALPGLQTGVAGKRVVLDPGHGPLDPGQSGGGLSEAAITASLAHLIEGRLAARGTQILLTRSTAGDRSGGALSEEERAAFCNSADADLVISLHVPHLVEPGRREASVFYYGRSDAVFSAAGHIAADAVCESIESNLDGLPCRVEARSWDLLRMTRMPAVRIEIGPLDDGPAPRLGDPRFLTALADAVTAGVEHFFQPPPSGDRAAAAGERALSGSAYS